MRELQSQILLKFRHLTLEP